MWIYQNDWKRREGRTSVGYWLNYTLVGFMALAGAFCLVAGFYASVVSIKNSFDTGAVGSPFSCACLPSPALFDRLWTLTSSPLPAGADNSNST